jgi:hypothetical protein
MTAVAEKLSATSLTDDDLVRLFVQIRDQVAAEKKVWDTRKAFLEDKMDRIGGIMMQRFNSRGCESTRTAAGTAFKHREYRANIADKDAVKQQLLEGAWELVTIIPNKEGIKQHIKEHGEVPAGVNWTEEVVIRVQRA